MKVEQMARKLQEMGYSVNIIFRKDSGARITKIGNKSFKGSVGNAEARKILGISLSEQQQRHLKNIKQKKGIFGRTRMAPLPPDMLDLQNEINKAFKKQGSSARVRRKQIRYRLKAEGEDKTRKYLKRALEYAKGYVYDEALAVIALRLKNDKGLLKPKEQIEIQQVIDAIDAIIASGMHLPEKDFKLLLEVLYDYEKKRKSGQMTTEMFKISALSILAKAE